MRRQPDVPIYGFFKFRDKIAEYVFKIPVGTDLTQERVAEKLGISFSQSTVGETKPSPLAVRRL